MSGQYGCVELCVICGIFYVRCGFACIKMRHFRLLIYFGKIWTLVACESLNVRGCWSYRPSSGHVFVKDSNQPAGRALSTASKETDSIRLATVKPDIVPANTAACAPNGSRSTPEPDMRSRAPAEPCDRIAMCDRGQPTDDRPTRHRLACTKGANAWALPHTMAMHIARGIAISIVCAKIYLPRVFPFLRENLPCKRLVRSQSVECKN